MDEIILPDNGIMDLALPLAVPIEADNGNEDSESERELSSPPLLCLTAEEGSPPEPRMLMEIPQENCNVTSSNDDGSTCPICLDNWSNYGEHRMCSLHCGHLFGLSCIQRWFSQKQRVCPTCKKKAFKKQIRPIYASRLVAMDTSEYENVKRELDAAKQSNTELKVELGKSRCHQNLLMQHVDCLKQQISDLTSTSKVTEPEQRPKMNSVNLYKEKSLEICKDAGCRVIDYYLRHNLIVASAKSQNALFPGFGVRKINISTFEPLTFVPLHSKPIRDFSFHSVNPWLLSVSLDKSLKVIDINSNTRITSFTHDAPLWACCWDLNNLNMLYVGKQGAVLKFDMRNMTGPLQVLEVQGDMSPVVSLAPLLDGFVKGGGVLVCKLNSLSAFRTENDEHVPLGLEGPFVSMKYQNNTNHLLVSTRPNCHTPYSRHMFSTIITSTGNNLLCNVVHSFHGGPVQTYLSRSCFADNQNDNYIVAHQEAEERIVLWSINSGQRVCAVSAHEPVLDLCSFRACDANYVVSLTERRMQFYKLS